MSFSTGAGCALGLLLASGLSAHGGQYRGPGDVYPNSPGGGGSSSSGGGSGGSGGGGSTISGGPTTPGAAGSNPSAVAGAAASPSARGAALGDDLTRWEFWWEFGKDPFLRLRDAVHGGRAIAADDALLNPRLAARAHDVELPTDADLERVADRLVTILGGACDRDTTSAGLIALAKIGRDGRNWRLRDVLAPFLQRNDQEIRETAALAYGIAGIADDATVELLSALVRNNAEGHRLSGGASVNERTRAFAAFGLGLLLQRTRAVAPARRIVDVLVEVLAIPAAQSRDLLVAAIEALSLFPRAWSGAAADMLREATVSALGAFYELPLGPGTQLVQAHVPPAIARLLRPDDNGAAHWRDLFARDLERQLGSFPAESGKANPHIAQSCALALGGLAPPWQAGDDVGMRLGTLLSRAYRTHKDHQTRRFALLSIGRIGGELGRDNLLREFDAAGRALEQPWVAMALGVMHVTGRGAGRSGSPDSDPELGRRLRSALASARNPSARAGVALALGLVGDRTAADELRELLREKAHQDDLAGYLCIALGLMRDELAIGDIRTLMLSSSRRPQVVFHCAQALGLLGDPRVVGDLCVELETREPSLVRLSAAAAALGQIGDRRSIAPLLRMLDREEITPLTRAFAVVGLGSVCDKDPLPWNAAYATNCNYLASTSTLTDGASGILDIL